MLKKTGPITSNANICFECANACGGCSWSAVDRRGRVRFEPVPGWTAEPVKLRYAGKHEDTYHITACPLFKRDKPRGNGAYYG